MKVIVESRRGSGLVLKWAERRDWRQWAELTEGAYCNSPRTVLEEIARIQCADVVLPVEDGPELRLRCIARPDQAQAALRDRLGLQGAQATPRTDRRHRDVVTTLGRNWPWRPRRARFMAITVQIGLAMGQDAGQRPGTADPGATLAVLVCGP